MSTVLYILCIFIIFATLICQSINEDTRLSESDKEQRLTCLIVAIIPGICMLGSFLIEK